MKKIKLLITSAIFSFAFISNFALAAPVNVNQAEASVIADSLNGIGIRKAQLIVDYRENNGLFEQVEDLAKVKGIGHKLLAKISQDILLKD